MRRYIKCRRAPACLLAALLLMTGAGRAQSGLDLRPLTAALEVLPRQTVNLVLAVTNHKDEPWTETLTVELPPGWRLVVPGGDISLGPGESSTQVITLLVPQQAEAGSYTVRVRGGESEEAEFLLTVMGFMALEVIAVDAPQLVVAEDYRAIFSVRNSGNATTEILIEAQDNLNLRLETRIGSRPHDESEAVALQAGEAVIVEVWVRVPDALANFADHRLILDARSRHDPTLTAKADVRVDLIPEDAGLAEAFHSFPLRLRAVATLNLDQITERPNSALRQGQVEISGTGKLWDRQPGTFRVEVGSDIYREEHRALVGYRMNDFRVAVGQQKFLSLPLLPDLEGVGAQIFGQVRPVDGGRFGSEVYALAADGQWNYGGGLQATLDSALRGWVHLGLAEEESHFGTRLQVLPGSVSASAGGATTDLDVEYARRWSATGETGSALRLQAGFEADQLEAKASFLAEEGGYDDDSSDSTTVFANATGILATPFPDLFKVRVRLDVDYPIGTLRSGVRAIEGYDSSVGLELSGRLADADVEIGYVHEESADYGRFPFSRQEDEYSVGFVTHPDPDNQFRQRFGFLRTVDSRRAGTRNSYLYLAGLRTRRAGGQLDSELEFAYSREQRGFTRMVLSSEWSGVISPQFNLLAGADWALVGDRIARLEVKGDYHPAPDRQLVVGLHGDFYSSRGASIRLDLSLNEAFQLRLGPLSTVGRVTGRVTDSFGNPQERLVVRLSGQSSVTDEEGRFLFPAVPEGSHDLSLHPESLKRNELTVPATPLTLHVEAQSEVNQDLVLLQGALLDGSVTYRVPEREGKAWESAHPPDEPVSLEGIRLILSDGQTTVRTLTDARGNFNLARLTPGRWRLSVESERLAHSYRFVPAEQILDIVPGRNQAVIELQPKERAIRFIDGGVIENDATLKDETGH